MDEAKYELPYYPRASIGSRHDLCKYGHVKHDLNTKASPPVVKGAVPMPQRRLPLPVKSALSEKKESSVPCRYGLQSNLVKSSRKVLHPEKSQVSKPKRAMEAVDTKTRQTRIGNAGTMGVKKDSASEARKNNVDVSRSSTLVGKKTSLHPYKSSTTPRDPIVPKRVSNAPMEGGKKKTNSPGPTKGIKTRRTADANSAPVLPVNEASKLHHPVHHHLEDTPEEKILYVVETNTQISEQPSPGNRKKQNSPSNSGLDHEGTCEDEGCSPHSLKFRKVKEREIHSKDSREIRLKFKQANVLKVDRNNKDNAWKKHKFRQVEQINDDQSPRKNAEVIKMKKSSKELADAKDTNVNEVSDVVLRQQQPKENESEQNSYDNVIKETARKMVRTQKSKVKALVGAFETVISLQDGKSRGRIRSL